MRKRVIDLAAIGATIVACCRIFGILSGIEPIASIGETFAIAPAPNPFANVYAPDYGRRDKGFLIGCESNMGEIKWTKWEHEARARVLGPHRRVIAILNYIRKIFGHSSVEDLQRREILTRYYFCTEKTLARALDCDFKIASVWFKIIPMESSHSLFETRIMCYP